MKSKSKGNKYFRQNSLYVRTSDWSRSLALVRSDRSILLKIAPISNNVMQLNSNKQQPSTHSFTMRPNCTSTSALLEPSPAFPKYNMIKKGACSDHWRTVQRYADGPTWYLFVRPLRVAWQKAFFEDSAAGRRAVSVTNRSHTWQTHTTQRH